MPSVFFMMLALCNTVTQRAHRRVEVQRLAQRDVDGCEAAADRRAARPLQRDLVLADRVQRARGEQLFVAMRERRLAREVLFEHDRRAGRGEHFAHRHADLGPNTITRNKHCRMSHEGLRCSVARAYTSSRSAQTLQCIAGL
jgi:hypothetical protein